MGGMIICFINNILFFLVIGGMETGNCMPVVTACTPTPPVHTREPANVKKLKIGGLN